MKIRTLIKTSLVLMAGLLTACGSDDKDVVTPDGKVDITKAVEFKVDFTDYNADEEIQVTRGNNPKNDTISKQYVDLGNKLLAEVTVQRDTTKTARKARTRNLDNGTYTMLAYQGGVYKGEVTGTIDAYGFHPSGNEGLNLEPGTYDFVLFNDKLTRVGDVITADFNPPAHLTDIENTYIGRATYTVTATPRRQQVTFRMKYTGARLFIKLISYMEHTALTGILSGTYVTAVPYTGHYQAALDTWSADNPQYRSYSVSYNFPHSTPWASGLSWYESGGGGYVYFLPGFDLSDLVLRIYGGKIYNTDMATHNIEVHFAPKVLQPNASYVIKIKLRYNFLYLMSDGTTDFINATQYTYLRKSDGTTPRYVDKNGTELTTPKIPVGVVLSQSKRLAVALKNAHYHTFVCWDSGLLGTATTQTNSIAYGSGQAHQVADSFNDMDGEKYTWDPAGSHDGTTVKATATYTGYPVFPAFYIAAHYSDELAASGVTVSGTLIGKKWHLPSNGEWKYFFKALGLGDDSNLAFNSSMNWGGLLANEAFKQVGGHEFNFYNDDYKRYWSSCEISAGTPPVVSKGACVSLDKLQMYWSSWDKCSLAHIYRVRPFIYY